MSSGSGAVPGWYNRLMKKRSGKTKLRRFTVVIEQDEDGYYVASVPALHMTGWK